MFWKVFGHKSPLLPPENCLTARFSSIKVKNKFVYKKSSVILEEGLSFFTSLSNLLIIDEMDRVTYH